MRTLPRIPSTAQLRDLEAEWIKQCNHGWSQVLMEIAGRAAAQVAFKMWLERPGRVAIACGVGNNGGDGLVVARYLTLWKVPVTVYIISKSESNSNELPSFSSEESKTNLKLAQDLEIEIKNLPEDFDSAITNCALIVDALLGTGLDRQVEGNYKRAIDAINRSLIRTLAVDVPSGINSDNGQVMGAAISAHRTVTFGYLKPGLLQHPGAQHAGLVSAVDIGLPELSGDNEIYLTTRDFVNATLPYRPDDSHKGTFGSVLMIGGSAGMFGAPVLSGQTVLRAGAGLCTVAGPKSVIPHLPAEEMIYKLLPETEDGSLSAHAVSALESDVEKASAVILGPGISQHSDTVKFVQQILPIIADSGKGCVVDADALNAIATDTKQFPKNAANFVLTPHPKELSRLMELSVTDIQKDRIAAVRQAAKRFKCTVVLKGSRTVTSDAEGTVYINPTGNSGMATAGSGDVLSGIIGSLIGQGVPANEAAVSGVYVHGMAGDIAAQALYGHTGIVAGDISFSVPTAISQIKQGAKSILEEQLSGDSTEAL